ncbi:MAG: glycosyltransferase family 87 protein [Vicinamibacterales bacterium]|nr:glycosyltransferase family 87 protein [Vicinamibacterales bacterium]
MTDAPQNGLNARRLGVASTAAVGLVLVAWALTVDVPRSSRGFFSDAATYYSLGHSLAKDLDFEYRREDLVRVWHEFPSGPEGIFLKRGRTVDLGVQGAFPFVTWTSRDDPDGERLYFGKSYIYPLVAAPFVALFGTNGFMVLHALLLTLVFACAYAFLVARGAPLPSLLFAFGFVFVSAAPVYIVWIMPEVFNLSLVMCAFFCWAYKEARAGTPGELPSWLTGWRSDVLAMVLLGVATFSKPTHVLLALPLLGVMAWRRQWRHAFVTGTVFSAVIIGLFALNVAITGEWNYQGGDRRTFYSGERGFPFQYEGASFDRTGMDRTTNRVPVEVLSSRDAVASVFRSNLGYFLVGRHTGFAIYFFPAIVALALFLWGWRTRPVWQWATLAAGVGSALALLLYMPYTYSGGGGPVGNRYFLAVYPLFLFLTPPLASIAPALTAIGVSAIFTAQLVLNPFYVSVNPDEHPKRGPYRMLPVELSLANDLPVNIRMNRVRRPLAGTPPISGYFLDDNAYDLEGDRFWVRGEARADLIVRAPAQPERQGEAEVWRSRRLRQLQVDLAAGPVANTVTIRTGAGSETVSLGPGEERSVLVRMPAGLPYKPIPENPTNYLYSVSIASASSFIPLFDQPGAGDPRVLGVFVRLVPIYE